MGQSMSIPNVLTIAGSDSGGGAGIQADLKTFAALRTYGASAITAVTAQNTQGVRAVHQVPPDIIAGQIAAVFEDLNIAAIKIGMIGDAEAIAAVASALERAPRVPVVLDPVMVAASGDALLAPGAEAALKQRLLSHADVLTPNLPEAARLLDVEPAGDEAAMRAQAEALAALGPKAVLIKGGHGTGDEALDILFDGSDFARFTALRVATKNVHGTGCTLSSAIAALLARRFGLHEAVRQAKTYLTSALAEADKLNVGQGAGPLNHFYAMWAATEPGG
jgi:hydroxymethylpyrimidine/phosphomethylpyrimidine kinase